MPETATVGRSISLAAVCNWRPAVSSFAAAASSIRRKRIQKALAALAGEVPLDDGATIIVLQQRLQAGPVDRFDFVTST